MCMKRTSASGNEHEVIDYTQLDAKQMVDYKHKTVIINTRQYYLPFVLTGENMSITPITKHNNHDIFIDCDYTNDKGLPALCCSQCTTPRGKRAGKPQWIQWINRADFAVLYSDPAVKFVGDPIPHLSKPTIKPINNYAVVRGECEPEYTEGVSASICAVSPGWR